MHSTRARRRRLHIAAAVHRHLQESRALSVQVCRQAAAASVGGVGGSRSGNIPAGATGLHTCACGGRQRRAGGRCSGAPRCRPAAPRFCPGPSHRSGCPHAPAGTPSRGGHAHRAGQRAVRRGRRQPAACCPANSSPLQRCQPASAHLRLSREPLQADAPIEGVDKEAAGCTATTAIAAAGSGRQARHLAPERVQRLNRRRTALWLDGGACRPLLPIHHPLRRPRLRQAAGPQAALVPAGAWPAVLSACILQVAFSPLHPQRTW